MDSLLHTIFVSYCRCIVLPLFCTFVVSNSRCCSLSLLLTFVVSYFRCLILLLFCTFFYFVLLVLYFRFFSIFCFTRLLFCTYFNTFLVMHFQFPGTYDPGFYVPQYLCSRFLGSPVPSPSPTHFIPQCLYALLLLSCTFGLILIFHGLYNVSRSLCSPGGPTYVPSPSVSYFRCFVLSLICTSVVSYFLYFVVSQFRYFTLQLFHTLWFRPFRTSPLFADTYIPRSYVPRSLCSPIPLFPDPHLPGPMFPDT